MNVNNVIKKNKLSVSVAVTFIVGLLVIISCCCYKIGDNVTIGIYPDELGYWAPAAYMLNLDWSSSLKYTSYYGFGYGLILVPLLAMFHTNSSLLYISAIILNIVFMVGTFCCVFWVVKNILFDSMEINHTVIALVVVLYSPYLLYTRTTLSESFLLLINWCVFIVFISYIKNKNVWKIIILDVLLLIGFCAHQRFLIVILVTLPIIVWLELECENGRNKIYNLLVIGLVICVGFYIIHIFKSNYKEVEYCLTSSSKFNTNDFGSWGNKIAKIFSFNELKKIIYALMGRIFYIGISTYGMVFGGIYYCIIQITKKMKEKNTLDVYTMICIWGVLVFVGGLAISCIYMPYSTESTRFDKVLYGRYTDYLNGPLVLIYLQNYFKSSNKKKNKVELIVLVFLNLIYPFIISCIPQNSINNNVLWISCPSMIEFVYGRKYSMQESVGMFLLRGNFIIGLLYIAGKKNFSKKNFVLISILVINMYSSCYSVNNICFMNKPKHLESNLKMLNIIDENRGDNEKIYSYEPDKYLARFQFTRPDLYIEDIENIENIPQNYLVITHKNYIDTSGNMQLVFEGNNNLKLWRKIGVSN